MSRTDPRTAAIRPLKDSAGPEERTPARRLGRQPRLNGLRALAISVVLAFHATRGRSLEGAYAGVDLFFVLSGFLITTLLVEEFAIEARISLPKFYMRRALRLLPALALLLVACVLIYMRVHGDLKMLMGRFIFATSLYSANAFEAFGHHLYWAHTWSLSAEEQFYVLWPPLLLLMLRSRLDRRTVVAVTAAAYVVASLPRIVFWRYGTHAGDAAFAFYSPLTHADGLLLGCLMGELYAWNLFPTGDGWRKLVRGGAVVALALGGVALVATSPRSEFLYAGGYTVVFIFCGVLVLSCLERDPLPALEFLAWRPVTYIGEISYGLYLWNPVFLFNYPGSNLNPLLGTALTFVVAAASFRFVEQPALRLKARFAGTRHHRDVVVEPARLSRADDVRRRTEVAP